MRLRHRLPIGLVCACLLRCPAAVQAADPAAAGDSFGTRMSRADADLRYWLQNMYTFHRFSVEEVAAATGLTKEEAATALRAHRIPQPGRLVRISETAPLMVLPYPGGRHPRIGFQEGAVNPQRDTKLSVFTPWDDKSYVVIDVPEAIWSNLGLMYLAHTHVPTLWTKAHIELPKLDWRRRRDGSFFSERKLPNGVSFATRAIPSREAVRLEIKLTNASTNHLSDLRVQMCAMLKGVEGFNQQTNANKVFAPPFSACKSEDGQRWILWAWQPVNRTWGNPPVPCLHSDPKFPDCKPGETKTIRGWLSFYEGTDIDSEMRRIEQDPWLFEIAAGVR
ncbi:MAG: hypothetical protein HYR88_01925 [Verrucomicrobia bacterium]|nr:hypothetical protein [Verrucomicrobiota bacterium]MBI3870771.1 hypothetical protein [Verrucomicrobiota bacterium]